MCLLDKQFLIPLAAGTGMIRERLRCVRFWNMRAVLICTMVCSVLITAPSSPLHETFRDLPHVNEERFTDISMLSLTARANCTVTRTFML